MSSSSRGIFATPGSRSFTKTPSVRSEIQETPKKGGPSMLRDLICKNRDSASYAQNSDHKSNSGEDFETAMENKIENANAVCSIIRGPQLHLQSHRSKKRSVIYTTPDDGNESNSSSFMEHLSLASSHSASGWLTVNVLEHQTSIYKVL